MSHREDGERLNERKQTFAPSGYHGEKKKNSVDENCFSTQKHGKSYVGWARWILLGYSRGEHGYLLEEMDRGWQLGPDNGAPLRTGSFATEHAHQGGWKRKGCIQAPQKLRA